MARAKTGRLANVRGVYQIWQIIRPSLPPDQPLLLAGILLSALNVGFRLAQPWPLKWIIDHVAQDDTSVTWLPTWLGEPIIFLVTVFVVVVVAGASTEYAQRLVLAILGTRVVHRFRAVLYDRVMLLPLSFHDRRDTGELITRLVYDTSRLRQGVITILTGLFQNAFFFIAAIALLLWVDTLLATIVGVSGVVSIVIMRRTGRRVSRAAKRARRNEGRLASFVTEMLLGIRDLQTFRPPQAGESRFHRRNRRSLRKEQRVRRLAAALVFRVEAVLGLTLAAVLLFGARRIQAGLLTPGDLVLFVHYTMALYRPYRQVARQAARFGRTIACADRLAKILSVQATVVDLAGAVEVAEVRGGFRLDGAWYRNPIRRQRGRKWTLRDVSLTVQPGERIALLGQNGAGKSSLLRLLLRLADPTRGSVSLDGRDIREYTVESVRRQMSVVFQESAMFSSSVFDNLALGRPGATIDDVRAVADQVGLAGTIARLPNGYDTRILQRGTLLSQGERQRMAIARALLRNGAIWLLDEPTSALDPDSQRRIVEVLMTATHRRTTIWVTHDEALLSCFDRVIVLDLGAVTFDGRPSALLGRRDLPLTIAQSVAG